ncbi:MAG: hypothetical protein DSY60_05320 [Persephonella sp.]|nr:MAG: hypothetical protein DSY60_05320 [Persephonella sp.]
MDTERWDGYLRFLGKKEDKFLILNDEELHHAKVRRIKLNEIIEVNTLDGNVYLGKVIEINKKFLKAEILEKLNVEESKSSITLYQLMPNKLSKIDDIIEPISELGVDKFVPVIGKFSSVKEKDILKKFPKWEKKALNSIKQCKRAFPVKIEKPVKIKDINASSEFNIVFYEKERNKRLKDFLDKSFQSVSVVIGGEGGFAEDEIKSLKEKGFITLSLGKNILRMETALITAIAQVQLILKD